MTLSSLTSTLLGKSITENSSLLMISSKVPLMFPLVVVRIVKTDPSGTSPSRLSSSLPASEALPSIAKISEPPVETSMWSRPLVPWTRHEGG